MNSTLGDWGSIASIVALVGLVPVLYNAYLQLRDRYRLRRARIIRYAAKPTWHLIRPTFDHNMARVEDVIACQEVSAKLSGLGYKVTVGGDHQNPPRGSNLVLVCGPKGNKASARLLKEIELPFTLVEKEQGWEFLDRRTHQTYRSAIEDGHHTDLALFGRVLDHAGNTCYILWGIHAVGTMGAGRAFADDRFLDETYKKVKDRNFVGIIHVAVTSPDDVEVVSWLVDPVMI